MPACAHSLQVPLLEGEERELVSQLRAPDSRLSEPRHQILRPKPHKSKGSLGLKPRATTITYTAVSTTTKQLIPSRCKKLMQEKGGERGSTIISEEGTHVGGNQIYLAKHNIDIQTETEGGKE